MRGRSMRPHVAIAALATVVLFLAPVASGEVAGEAVLDFESPAAADMTVDLTISGQDAQDARQAIDSDAGPGASGNGDGEVTQDEVDAFEELLKSFFNKPEATIGSEMTIDGENASASNLTAFDIRDATGDANSTEPLEYHMVMRIEWPVTSGDEHTFVASGGGNGTGQSQEDVSLTIRAPEGYTISSTDGLPEGADVSDEEVTYDSAEGQGAGDITLVFSRSGGPLGGAPGPGVVLVVLVALGLAVARRRR